MSMGGGGFTTAKIRVRWKVSIDAIGIESHVAPWSKRKYKLRVESTQSKLLTLHSTWQQFLHSSLSHYLLS
jgi:hypothetical protein